MWCELADYNDAPSTEKCGPRCGTSYCTFRNVTEANPTPSTTAATSKPKILCEDLGPELAFGVLSLDAAAALTSESLPDSPLDPSLLLLVSPSAFASLFDEDDVVEEEEELDDDDEAPSPPADDEAPPAPALLDCPSLTCPFVSETPASTGALSGCD